MNGKTLKENFRDYEIFGNLDVEFNSIKTDSRKVTNHDLFVAMKGENADGHNYVLDAVNRGAVGVIVEDEVNIPKNVLVIKVRDSKEAFARISSFFFGEPSKYLKIIGVTGTMGKTSITYLLYRLFNYLKVPSAFIGTIGIGIKDAFFLTDLEPPTTPFPFELHKYLKTMFDKGVKYVFMEVSSHGIKDKRIFGIDFYRKILGTMGIDHLDYHKTFEDYLNTKISFFDGSKSPILNGDSLFVDKFVEVSDMPIFYGSSLTYNFSFSYIKNFGNSVSFDVYEKGDLLGSIDLPILGEYNVYNFMAVLSFAMEEGISFKDIKDFAKKASIPGRMDIYNFNGIKVVIDYAHNPEEIENVLRTFSKRKGRLIVVFGAVGTSTKEKRVLMGKIVSKHADFCVVTSDDPRGFNESEIIKDIVEGVYIESVVIPDRKEAITYALKNAKENDIVAILGRGVESVMHLSNGVVLHFRDIDVVKEVFNEN